MIAIRFLRKDRALEHDFFGTALCSADSLVKLVRSRLEIDF